MKNIERILCLLDTTGRPDTALPFSTALADAFRAKLYLCYCMASPDPSSEIESARSSAQREIPNVRGGNGPQFEIISVKGDLVQGIAREVARHRIDLIVMQLGRRSSPAPLLGAMAEAVCRTTPCPLLVTRPRRPGNGSPARTSAKIREILAAYDFSTDSELALSYAVALSRRYHAKLHLMHVLPPPEKGTAQGADRFPSFSDSSFQQTSARLKHVISSETGGGIDSELVLSQGEPYLEILTYAEQHHADLICMGTFGTDFTSRSLFGSNTDRVLRQAPCSVLVVHPLRSGVWDELNLT
jgi:nucleotide-binding universal stress UspA family protein